MAVNLAEKYSKKVDEKFTMEELTGGMGGADYDFVGVNAVHIYKIEDAPLNDYKRTGTNRYGNPEELSDGVETFTLSQDKSFTFTIDRGNNNEQMMIKESGKALARQIKNVVVPYRDTYNLSVATNKAILNGNVVNATLTKENSYEKVLDCTEIMDNGKVPAKGRRSWFRPKALNLIKRCPDFTRNIDYNKPGQKVSVGATVGNIDDIPTIMTPGTYFQKNVNGVIEHPAAMCTPKTLADYKIHSNPPGVNGWLIEGRVIFDAFVLDNKAKGIVTLIDGAIGLETTSVAGASGKTKLNFTLPNGLTSTDLTAKYKLANATITLPDFDGADTNYNALTVNTEITVSTNTHYAIVLSDTNGKVKYAGTGTIVAGA